MKRWSKEWLVGGVVLSLGCSAGVEQERENVTPESVHRRWCEFMEGEWVIDAERADEGEDWKPAGTAKTTIHLEDDGVTTRGQNLWNYAGTPVETTTVVVWDKGEGHTLWRTDVADGRTMTVRFFELGWNQRSGTMVGIYRTGVKFSGTVEQIIIDQNTMQGLSTQHYQQGPVVKLRRTFRRQ